MTTKDRWPDLPMVPTVDETGFPGYEYSAWIGVLGRRGMPEAEIVNIEQQLLAICATEDTRSRLYKQGIVLVPKGRSDFKTAIAHDAVLNRDLVKTIGMKMD